MMRHPTGKRRQEEDLEEENLGSGNESDHDGLDDRAYF